MTKKKKKKYLKISSKYTLTTIFCVLGIYTYLMTTKFGGELQQPITGITFGCEKILNLGYSSLKSREILGVHSLNAKTLAAISFPCHLPGGKKCKNLNFIFL